MPKEEKKKDDEATRLERFFSNMANIVPPPRQQRQQRRQQPSLKIGSKSGGYLPIKNAPRHRHDHHRVTDEKMKKMKELRQLRITEFVVPPLPKKWRVIAS